MHPTNDPLAQARQALHQFFAVMQAMSAVVNTGRFDTAHDDVVQHFAYLLKLFVAQLDECYSPLADLLSAAEEGGAA